MAPNEMGQCVTSYIDFAIGGAVVAFLLARWKVGASTVRAIDSYRRLYGEINDRKFRKKMAYEIGHARITLDVVCLFYALGGAGLGSLVRAAWEFVWSN